MPDNRQNHGGNGSRQSRHHQREPELSPALVAAIVMPYLVAMVALRSRNAVLMVVRFDMPIRRLVIVPRGEPMNVRHEIVRLPEKQDHDQ